MATEELKAGDRVLYVTAGREGIVENVLLGSALVDFGAAERFWCLARNLRRIALAGGPASARSEAPRCGGAVRSLKILVVDDDRDTADLFAQLLETSGHTAQVLYRGASLRETALWFKPDVVFLDLFMPETDGYEAARVFRSDPALADVWLVAITGFASPASITKVRDAGCDGYYLKPIAMDTLDEVLAQSSLPRPSRPDFLVGPRLMAALRRAKNPQELPED